MCQTPKAATPITAEINQGAVHKYDTANRRDFADAGRGLIAELPGNVLGADGSVIFDPTAFDYLEDAPTPDTVNPSLWIPVSTWSRRSPSQPSGRDDRRRGGSARTVPAVNSEDVWPWWEATAFTAEP